MYIDEFRDYCLRLPEVTEGIPFGPEVLVFKVCNKIFALTGIESSPLSVNLKCEPELAELLREKHLNIQPGYHMNKKHWNTVLFDGTIPQQLCKQMIDHSYFLIVSKLPLKEKQPLLEVITQNQQKLNFRPVIEI